VEKIDLIELYDNEIRPNLPLDQVYSSLNPIDKGDYYEVDCPSCGERGRAYIYKNSGILKCNRISCSFQTDPMKFTYGRDNSNPAGPAWVDIVKKHGAMANIPVPEQIWSAEQTMKHAVIMRKRDILEDFHRITQKALEIEGYPAGREYLEKRGWTPELITQLDFGYYPSKDYIKAALEKLKYSNEEISTAGILRDDWGGRVVGPIRNLQHHIANFWARDTTGNAFPKMSYMTNLSGASLDVPLGLDKATSSNLIVVEGIFDYLTLDAHGIKNVIALGGANLTNGHYDSLQKAKVKSITLLLDNDKADLEAPAAEPAGRKATRAIIEKYANSDLEIYVIPPESMGDAKDPDELVRKCGIKALENILADNKEHGFRYLARDITQRCNKSGQWHDAERVEAFEIAKKFEGKITNGTLGLQIFWEEFVSQTGISQEIVDQCRQTIQEKKILESKNKLIEELYKKIAAAQDSEDPIAAQKEITKISDALKELDFNHERAFSFLLEKNSRAQLIEDFKTEIPAINTGYKIGDRDLDLSFPAGALTIIAGPTGHGKTTALINFSLGTSNKNPDTSIYFLTYEESAHHVLAKLLNTYANVPVNNGNNKGAIYHYLKAAGGEANDPFQFFTQDRKEALAREFQEKEKAFFKNLVDTGRLKVLLSDMSAEDLAAAIKFIKQNDPRAGLIVIDYIQLLETQNPADGKRHEDMKYICTLLRKCAIETGIAIVLAAQFNRDVQIEDQMSLYKIGEAHGIAQEAELIIGLWNRSHNEMNPSNEIFFKVLKGRNIGFGHTAVMSFDGNVGTISNVKNSPSPQKSGNGKQPTSSRYRDSELQEATF
jgi:DNA primase